MRENLPAWMQSRNLGLAAWQIFGLLGLILLGFILRTIVAWFFSGQAQRLMQRLGVVWGQGNSWQKSETQLAQSLR